MPFIHILDEATINQIAAGEVVERPSAVVKELIENAVDAGATAITAEIKEGGLSFIRITDNGAGIAKEDIPLAFLRHATSKIKTAQDLFAVTSLGFRGEALSSIASVAQVELISKTPTALNGYRYIIEGGEEKTFDEIGCPGGTTILVRNLFYNTPARRKFLKSAMTEAGYISDLMERLMVSHPNISFKFIMNNQLKLQSSGNNNTKDILYQVYGRDITRELLPLEAANDSLKATGYIGKPLITRGNRNFENYFINGRYIKSSVITKAIEEAYKPFLMQHKYPFTSIYFEIDPAMIDVNVHPQKLEIRLKNGEEVYQFLYHAIRDALAGKELIPKVTITKQEEAKEQLISQPEPFEINRRSQPVGTDRKQPSQAVGSIQISYNHSAVNETGRVAEQSKSYSVTAEDITKASPLEPVTGKGTSSEPIGKSNVSLTEPVTGKGNTSTSGPVIGKTNTSHSMSTPGKAHSPEASLKVLELLSEVMSESVIEKENENYEQSGQATSSTEKAVSQLSLFTADDTTEDTPNFLSKKALEEHRIIGQLFSTYWLVEYKKELYIIDQHAAHEKVLYERLMTSAKERTHSSQQLLPPIVLTLTLREQELLQKRGEVLESIGYEFEHFGGNEFSVRAVPADLYGLSDKELLLEFIDDLVEDVTGGVPNANSILERVASLSCKAAVKANHTFSYEEAAALIKELLTLENPYHCPHGRPVIISMSQYELERKFKRII